MQLYANECKKANLIYQKKEKINIFRNSIVFGNITQITVCFFYI